MSTLCRIARAIEVHYIIESVKIPQEEQDIVCNVLNGIPTMIQASRVCAASRPRLFWTSFEISPLKGESLAKGGKTNVLHFKKVPIATLAQFWVWGPTKTRKYRFLALQVGNRNLAPGPRNHTRPQQRLRGRKDTLEGRRLGYKPDPVRGHANGTRNKRHENPSRLANIV